MNQLLLEQVKEQLAVSGAELTEVEISQALRASGALESGSGSTAAPQRI